MITQAPPTPSYDKYTLGFGHVSLPAGLCPRTLLTGIGLEGKSLKFMGDGSKLLRLGAYRFPYTNRFALEAGLRAMDIEFVYTPWQNKEGEYCDSNYCFWASLCGILAYGKKVN